MNALFPLAFGSDELFLLSGLGLGFFFGFSLERAGFGSARKLAAQFYFHDMAVFKVMFTAIIVAMAGLYALNAMGYVDLARMWINPTFVWAQAIGGFLLGVGFIMSGLCPGTSVVSMASGRYDGLVTLVGIFVGTALFAVALDLFPPLLALYEHGGEVSLLPALLHLPPAVVALAVVAVAIGAFVGAERVERMLQDRQPPVEWTAAPTVRALRVKFGVGGALAALLVVSLAWKSADRAPGPRAMTAVAPLDLADAIIARDPRLVLLDLRPSPGEATIPGAQRAGDSSAVELLAAAPAAARVVVFDDVGLRRETGARWPAELSYYYLEGGFAGWRAEVLTPAAAEFDAASRARAERQRQVAAYFTGGVVQAAPPPAAGAGGPARGAGGKKRGGGC
jgi:uncharacterized membrane protein YedE/YeeE